MPISKKEIDNKEQDLTIGLPTNNTLLSNWIIELEDGINLWGSDFLYYSKIIESLDLYLRGLIETRISAAASLDWCIFDVSDNIVDKDNDNITTFVYELLNNIEKFSFARKAILRCIADGVSICQMFFQRKEDKIFIKNIRPEFIKNFNLNQDDTISILSKQNGVYKYKVLDENERRRLIITKFNNIENNPYGEGLYRKNAFFSYLKFNIMSWYLTYMKRAGVGAWFLQITDKKKLPQPLDANLLLNKLKDISNSTRGVIDEGLELFTPEVKTNDATSMFLEAITWLNRQHEIAVTGSSGTIGDYKYGNRSSQESFFNRYYLTITNGDAQLLYESINIAVKYLIEINFGKNIAENWCKMFYVSHKTPEVTEEEKANISKIKAETQKIIAETEVIKNNKQE